MAGVQEYNTTAASNTTINSINIAEGCPFAGINNAIRQQLADQRTQWNTAEWFAYGTGVGSGAVTYASATSFTVAGVDVTAAWHTGRRVKAVAATPGTIYGTISSSTFSTNTTVNVTWDSGSLSNEALTAYLGTASATNQSLPQSSVTIKGTVELATTAEAETGTDTARAVTPAGVKAVVDALSIPVGATTTVAGTVELAIQAEVLAATDAARVAALNMMHHHPGVAKAWATFAGASGTIPTDGSYGVTSVTRNSAGNYTINFSVTFANNDYAIVVTPTGNVSNSGYGHLTTSGTRTTTACQIDCVNGTNNTYDPTEVCVAVFGKLA